MPSRLSYFGTAPLLIALFASSALLIFPSLSQAETGATLGQYAIKSVSAQQYMALQYGVSRVDNQVVDYFGDGTNPFQQFSVVRMGSTQYELRDKPNGLCLTATTAGIVQENCTGSNNQLFILNKQSDGSYQIGNGNKCVVVPSTFASVVTGDCSSNASWTFVPENGSASLNLSASNTTSSSVSVSSSGTPTPTSTDVAPSSSSIAPGQYALKSVPFQQYMALAYGASHTDYPVVDYFGDGTNPFQQFVLTDMGSGQFELKEKTGGLCVSITSNGVLQENCTGAGTQLYSLTKQSDGSYQIKNTASGNCLTVPSTFSNVTAGSCDANADWFLLSRNGSVTTPSTTPVASTPAATTPTFKSGDRVMTTDSVNVRAAVSTVGQILAKEARGKTGTVTDGPSQSNSYTWWNIAYDDGAAGWSVESYLAATTIQKPAPVTPVTVPAPVTQPSSSETPVTQPTTPTFKSGDRVMTTDSVNVRDGASAQSAIRGKALKNATGTVTTGPVQSGSYKWWKIDYDNGLSGWSAESYLTATTIQKPVTTPSTPTTPVTTPSSSTDSSQSVTTVVPKNFRLMTLGDSMTQGYGGADVGGYRGPLYQALLSAGYAPQMVGTISCGTSSLLPANQQNCDGVGGNTLAQIDARVKTGIVTTNNPDVVLILGGFNSIYYTYDSTQTDLDNLQQIIEDVHAQKPSVHIIVSSLVGSTQCCNTNKIAEYNAGIPGVVAKLKAQGYAITYVDMYPVVPSNDLYDYVHPNSDGYRLMAATWLNAIKAIVPLTTTTSVNTTSSSSSTIASASSSKNLDLTGYKLTFDDEFNKLDISDSTTYDGSNWYTHNEQCCMMTTDGSGTAMVGLSSPQNPYSILPGGGLNIRLQKTNNTWTSGVITSVDNSGKGFSQKYGYFEMKAKLPAGTDTWPAFWLLNTAAKSSNAPAGEADIVEYIANPGFRNYIVSTLHDWSNGTTPSENHVPVSSVPSDGNYHTYGMKWTPDTITFYYDGVQTAQTSTPTIMHQPYYMLADLGIGAGWPTDKTPSTNDMQIQYIRAYSN